MKVMRLIWLVAVMMGLAGAAAHAAPGPWEQPASELADQIAAILGPGQAHLTIRNLSSISSDEIPAIRRLLTQDLKAHGVAMASAESANTIRVTLSESNIGKLWVAEIGEGNVTQVAMVQADIASLSHPGQIEQDPILLRKVAYLSHFSFSRGLPFVSDDPVLATIDPFLPIALYLDKLEFFVFSEGLGLQEDSSIAIRQDRSLPRDPRGLLILSADKNSFSVFLPGTACAGSRADQSAPAKHAADAWKCDCHASDDPWPIAVDASGTPQLKAFYNSARDYFTGVVSPSVGVDLPPFYAAALLPRSAGNGALLIGGIDGRVQLAQNGALKVVTGTRDWGSDFAVLHSGCGAGVQVIASSSGEAANDSLRAYELPALEAVPASAPLAMDGTVTALWTAPDGKSVLAVVRNAANEYEVDRVTALCN